MAYANATQLRWLPFKRTLTADTFAVGVLWCLVGFCIRCHYDIISGSLTAWAFLTKTAARSSLGCEYEIEPYLTGYHVGFLYGMLNVANDNRQLTFYCDDTMWTLDPQGSSLYLCQFCQPTYVYDC